MRPALTLSLLVLAGASLALGQTWREKGPRPHGADRRDAAPQPLPTVPDDAPPVEQLTRFDYRLATLDWDGKRWQLRAGTVLLKDFGTHEAEAREALRIVRTLCLTQRGTVGSPQPVMEYWLAEGHAPQALAGGFRTTPFDLEHLRVERVQAAWCIRDDDRVLLTFGPHADQARQALAVLRRYGFSRVGYVGGGVPFMMYFLAGQSRGDAFRDAGPAAERTAALRAEHATDRADGGGERMGCL
jgi:hypothetical protein